MKSELYGTAAWDRIHKHIHHISTGREKSCVRVYNDVVHTLNGSIVPAAHNLIDELLWNGTRKRKKKRGTTLRGATLGAPDSVVALFFSLMGESLLCWGAPSFLCVQLWNTPSSFSSPYYTLLFLCVCIIITATLKKKGNTQSSWRRRRKKTSGGPKSCHLVTGRYNGEISVPSFKRKTNGHGNVKSVPVACISAL